MEMAWVTGCNGKENHKGLLRAQGQAKSRALHSGVTPEQEPPAELPHRPPLPRMDLGLIIPAPGSVCLHLQNACFSIYIFIYLYILCAECIHNWKFYYGSQCTTFHNAFRLCVSITFHLPPAYWMEKMITNEKARENYIWENRELWIVLVLVQLNYLNWHLFLLQSYSSKVQFLF